MDSLYHVWFSTKGRKPVFEGEIGDEVRQLLVDTALRTGIKLLEVETVVDHVHALVAVKETQTLPSIMHQLKGASARYIFSKYPDLRFDLASNSFWQKGYGRRKLAPAEVSVVRNYIRTQRERPVGHYG